MGRSVDTVGGAFIPTANEGAGNAPREHRSRSQAPRDKSTTDCLPDTPKNDPRDRGDESTAAPASSPQLQDAPDLVSGKKKEAWWLKTAGVAAALRDRLDLSSPLTRLRSVGASSATLSWQSAGWA